MSRKRGTKSFGRSAYAFTTATATPSEKCVSILLWNFSYVEIYLVFLSVLKLALAEYATNAFSFK